MDEIEEGNPVLRVNIEPEETNLDSRDPKMIHKGMVKVDFKYIIAEPDDVRSVDVVWFITSNGYTLSRWFLYCTMSSILGIPLSLIWGLLFALLSFFNIWLIVPFIKFCLFIFECMMHPVLNCMEFWFQSPLRVVINAIRMLKDFRKAAL